MTAAEKSRRQAEAEAKTQRAVVASQAHVALEEAARFADGRKMLTQAIARAEKTKESLWDALYPARKSQMTRTGAAFNAAMREAVNRLHAVVERTPGKLPGIGDFVSACAWLVAIEAEYAPTFEAKAWRDMERDLSRVAERLPGKRDMAFVDDFCRARWASEGRQAA